MKIKIAIPSYGRADSITTKTLSFLRRGGFDLQKCVTIWVASDEQKEIYAKHVPKNMYESIRVAQLGIPNARNFIMRSYKPKQWVLCVDDDIEELHVATSEKEFVRLDNVKEFVETAFLQTTENHAFMWGIYPVHNAMWAFRAPQISVGLTFIVGQFFGFIVHESKAQPQVEVKWVKEDIELSILHFLRDGAVVRFNRIVAKTKNLNPIGGVGAERMEKNETDANFLLQKYNQFLFAKRRKNGMLELQMRRNKISTK